MLQYSMIPSCILDRMVSFFKNRQGLLLLALLLFAFIVRLPYPLSGSFAFTFDHGKDSLAVMHMVTTYSLKFVGPWTSIPGLFFGPGWYYFLAPFFLIGGFSPASGVYAMMTLLVGMVAVAYKRLGFFEAVVFACAPLWISISTSAWNPFPLTATSLAVALLLLSVPEKTAVAWKKMGAIGIASSLGFHFSSAFAIFYLPIIIASLFVKKARLSFRSLVTLAAGFGVPFVPQLLFELKNNFSQTRGVYQYFFAGGSSDTFDVSKVTDLLRGVVDTIIFSVLPEIRTGNDTFNLAWKVLFLLALAATLFWFVARKKYQARKNDIILCLIFILIPVVGLSFLHYNPWYLLGLAPSAVILFGIVVSTLPQWARHAWVACFLLTPLSFLYVDFNGSQASQLNNKALYRNKVAAISLIREQAGGESFSSYHYEPAIYDFSYQYIYLLQARSGQALPVQFAYLPNVPAYIAEKSELLATVPAPASTAAQHEFYIVESPVYEDHLAQWWQTLGNPEVEEVGKIGTGITLYKKTSTP